MIGVSLKSVLLFLLLFILFSLDGEFEYSGHGGNGVMMAYTRWGAQWSGANTNLVKGIISNVPSIISSAATIISNLLATFAKNLPQFLQQGITMLGQVAAGLIQAIPTLIGKIPTIFSNIVSAFKKHDWLSIGADIISGIAKGIINGIGSIVTAAKEAANSAFQAAKEKLGIKSPSRVMRDGVGRWIPAGIAVGIERNASMVSSAMDELTKSATGTINADVAMGIGQSRFGNASVAGRNSAQGGFQQNVNIYSPRELSPSEVARQTRNATRNMVLSLPIHHTERDWKKRQICRSCTGRSEKHFPDWIPGPTT